jgi:hypothetical protein
MLIVRNWQAFSTSDMLLSSRKESPVSPSRALSFAELASAAFFLVYQAASWNPLVLATWPGGFPRRTIQGHCRR